MDSQDAAAVSQAIEPERDRTKAKALATAPYPTSPLWDSTTEKDRDPWVVVTFPGDAPCEAVLAHLANLQSSGFKVRFAAPTRNSEQR